MLLAWAWHQRERFWSQGWRQLAILVLLWGGTTLVTVWVVWPALWVAPAHAIGTVINEVIDNGGQPQKGTFILGEGRIYEAPGPLYYPITLTGPAHPWC
ncbi:MAG: hypothetical protein HC837_16735 [Chloroflexaceae bacterium]|nr:hypothetical protein [Chloroflexaceae bacterium]